MDTATVDRPAATPESEAPGAPSVTALPAALRHDATRAVLLAAALVAAGLLFHELVTLFAAGVIAIILAIALSAFGEPLVRRGVPRPLAALAGLLVMLGIVAGAIALIVPPILDELRGFADRLPQAIEELAGSVATVTGGDGAAAADRVERAIERLPAQPMRYLGPVASVGVGIAGIASALVLILITAYYMAARPEPLVGGLLRLFPPPRRDKVSAVLARIHEAWRNWLKGVLVDMAVTGGLLCVGLLAIGLDFAILFAALSALLVVVPYFGAIAGGIPPVLFALAESPELALLTLGVYVVVQQIEGNVIVPLVMARAVKLHPALIAIGVVVVANLFGIVGLLVAVPLTAAAVILVDEIWVQPLERRRGVQVPRLARRTSE